MELFYESELCHHGVLGQKWGVRRYQNADGSYTRTGKARYSGTKIGYHKLTSNSAIEFAKDVGQGMFQLATYIPVLSQVAWLAKKANTRFRNFEKEDGPIEPLKSLPKIPKESPEDAVSRSNQGRAWSGSGREVNCACCSMAMDLRRRGYDVVARRRNIGLTVDEIQSAYKGSTYIGLDLSWNTKPQAAYDILYDSISKTNKGNSSGIVTCSWKEFGGGHAFYYDSKDGNVTFYDGQNGKYGSKIDSYFVRASANTIGYVRTDNCSLTEDTTKYIVRSKRR